MSEPIFFIVRRTAAKVTMHAATDFSTDGTFMPMRGDHPSAREASIVLGAFVRIAQKLDPARISADKLYEAARGYLNNDVYDRLRLIPANQRANLPARICLRGV